MTREEQIQYIKENFLDKPVKTMAKELGRSHCFVFGIMKKEGLKVSPEIIEERKRNSQFKPGMISFNKGMKQSDYMSPDKIKRSIATRFKKGQLPHNTQYDGHISIRESKGRKYAWIRVSKGKYRMLHRLVYEHAFGQIPRNYNVQFKDGNTLNCAIDNLYLISRSEQARINKLGGKEIPFELQRSILLVQDLNKKINEKQN